MELLTKPVGSYEYYPPIHPVLKGADIVLDKLIMQRVSRGVISHHWHWDRLPFDAKFKDFAIPVPGNPKAPKIPNGPAGNFLYWAKGHLGAVTEGYLLDVDVRSLPTPFDLGDFFYGFSDKNMQYLNRSRVAMNRMFMMLARPDDWYAFLMDKEGNPLPGKLLTPLITWDEKPAGIAIL